MRMWLDVNIYYLRNHNVVSSHSARGPSQRAPSYIPTPSSKSGQRLKTIKVPNNRRIRRGAPRNPQDFPNVVHQKFDNPEQKQSNGETENQGRDTFTAVSKELHRKTTSMQRRNQNVTTLLSYFVQAHLQ